MADTFKDRINNVKTPEELEAEKEAAYRESLEAGEAPISPIGGAIQGQSPDQAKMMGTKEQKSGALAQAAAQAERTKDIDQEKTLAGRMEEMSYEGYVDPTAERAKEFTSKMQEFGDLGSRVEAQVLKELAGPSDEEFVVQIELDDEQVKSLSAGDAEATKEVLDEFNRLAQDEDDTAAFQYLAQNKDKFRGDDNAVFDIISSAYNNNEEAQTAALAKAISQNVVDAGDLNVGRIVDTLDPEFTQAKVALEGLVEGTPEHSAAIAEMQNIPLKAFGGLTVADMVDMVGEDWYTKTPSQIGDLLDQKRDEILGGVRDIQQQLQNPNLSPAVREVLLNELRKYAATGVLQEEARAQQIVDDVKDSGKIRYGDKIVDIAELMDDENVQASVSEYLSLDEDDPRRAKLAEQNPDFYEWIDREMKQIMGAGDNVEDAVSSFKDIQDANEEKIRKSGYDPELLELFGVDTEGWSAEEIQLPENDLKRALPVYEKTKNIRMLADQYAKDKNQDKFISSILGEGYGNSSDIKKKMEDLRVWANFGDSNANLVLSRLDNYFDSNGKPTQKLNGIIASLTDTEMSPETLMGDISKELDRLKTIADYRLSRQDTTLRGIEKSVADSVAAGATPKELFEQYKNDFKSLGELNRMASSLGANNIGLDADTVKQIRYQRSRLGKKLLENKLDSKSINVNPALARPEDRDKARTDIVSLDNLIKDAEAAREDSYIINKLKKYKKTLEDRLSTSESFLERLKSSTNKDIKIGKIDIPSINLGGWGGNK